MSQSKRPIKDLEHAEEVIRETLAINGCPPMDFDDLSQELLIGWWQLSTEKKLKIQDQVGHLRTAARRDMINYRALKRHDDTPYTLKMEDEYASETFPTPDSNEFADDYEEAVRRLPPRQREVWSLIEERGLTQVEAGKILGIIQPTVRESLAAARANVNAVFTMEG